MTIGARGHLVVIGQMKCGTTAVHRYLDAHPHIEMAPGKEVNFFFGAPPHGARSADDADEDVAASSADPAGQWWRGTGWYAELFTGGDRMTGEASPGYSSPDHPEVASRLRRVVPDAHVVYLVRDPLQRALSQFRHHRRDGAEQRPVTEALLDEDSQYVARSRYLERLAPFLAMFPTERVHVVVSERLHADTGTEMGRLYGRLGVDPGWRGPELADRWNTGGESTPPPPGLAETFTELVRDDTERLRELLGDPLPEWDRPA